MEVELLVDIDRPVSLLTDSFSYLLGSLGNGHDSRTGIKELTAPSRARAAAAASCRSCACPASATGAAASKDAVDPGFG